MKKTFAAAFLLGTCIASGAQAQQNPYGYDQIAAKNMRAAEQTLVAQSATEPDEPSVLLNLAYVYKKTARASEAAALYERVLAQPDVLMALGSGKPAWSHMLAMKGLGRSANYAGR